MEIPKLINKDVFTANETVNEQEDVYIADIFSGMRFSMPFINYFIKQGKTMMSQLTETDIIDAVNIRESENLLQKNYIEYIVAI